MALRHIPVLVEELLALLQPRCGGVYVDGTIGAGGMALSLLQKAGPEGRLIGIDQDPEALTIARETLASCAGQVTWVEGNFENISEILKENRLSGVDGIYADLGLSSMQLAEGNRGFSFQQEGPLDMRMSLSSLKTAWEILSQSSEESLADILFQYGEERLSRKIARRIKEALHEKKLKTTLDLANLVFYCYPPQKRHGRIHPATRTFQALRIAVNRELEALKKFLAEAPFCLKPRGVLALISYHSLEDRLVKNAFRHFSKEGFSLLTKKPIVASREEQNQNPRSRSGKLRGLKKEDLKS